MAHINKSTDKFIPGKTECIIFGSPLPTPVCFSEAIAGIQWKRAHEQEANLAVVLVGTDKQPTSANQYKVAEHILRCGHKPDAALECANWLKATYYLDVEVETIQAVEAGKFPEFPATKPKTIRYKDYIPGSGEEAGLDMFRAKEGKAKGMITLNPRSFKAVLGILRISAKYNLLSDRIEIKGLEHFGSNFTKMDPVIDWLVLRLSEPDYRFKKSSREEVSRNFTQLALENPYHPVKDYIDTLKWDGVARIDTWLTRLAGADDSAYTRAASSLTLMAAVKRVYQPGCKFDELLVIQSDKQGLGKSTAIAALVPDEAWFLDDLPLTASTKEALEQTAGKWIVEIAELSGYSKADHNRLKAFLSRRADKARLAFRRDADDVPRGWVSIGTLNDKQFLGDYTGDRRYWPVTITKHFDLETLRQERDQIWAEAYHRVMINKESLMMAEDLWAAAETVRKDYTITNPIEEALDKVLGSIEGMVDNATLWDMLNVPVINRKGNPALKKAMENLGWNQEVVKKDKKTVRAWVKGDSKTWITGLAPSRHEEEYEDRSQRKLRILPNHNHGAF
jgi:predicted P-loop ATPase